MMIQHSYGKDGPFTWMICQSNTVIFHSYVKLQEGSRCWCDGLRVVMFQRSSELKTSKRMT